MYRLKTNGKYVLLVEDLGLTISYENEKGITLTDEQFETSNDIKKILRYLSVEKDSDTSAATNKTVKQTIEPEKVTTTAFVARQEEKTSPDGVFVKMPIDEQAPQVELPSVEKTEEVKVEAKAETEAEKTVKVETKVEEVVEPKTEEKKNDFDKIEKQVKESLKAPEKPVENKKNNATKTKKNK
jgi:hypothetical protein